MLDGPTINVPGQSTDATKTNAGMDGPVLTVSNQDADGEIDFSNVSFNPDKIAAALNIPDIAPNQQGNFVRVGTFRKKKSDNRPTIIPSIESPIASPSIDSNSLSVKNNESTNFPIPVVTTANSMDDSAAPAIETRERPAINSATMKRVKEPVNQQANDQLPRQLPSSSSQQFQLEEDNFVSTIEENFKSSQGKISMTTCINRKQVCVIVSVTRC